MATFQTRTDALYFLGMNVKQILMFGEGGKFMHEAVETMQFVQIINAVVAKADSEPLLKKEMNRVRKRDDSRMFSASGGEMTLYQFFVALQSSDTCGMMAQNVLEGYIKSIGDLSDRVMYAPAEGILI